MQKYAIITLTNSFPTNFRIRFRASREFSVLRRFITLAYIYYIQRRFQMDEYEIYGNDAPEKINNILY
jgi:hypothetical protein